jgi:hypothetical protein
MQSAKIIGGNPAKGRKENDFYPTPPEVTIALINFLQINNILAPNSSIWEPACGNNAMVNVLEQYGYNVHATDIITGDDYLTTQPNQTFDAIITNPPFNLADAFITKAVEETDVVAMVLKGSYWHAKKRYDIFSTFPPAWVLPLTWRPDFGGGGCPTMEVIWSVWIQGRTETRYMPLVKPIV